MTLEHDHQAVMEELGRARSDYHHSARATGEGRVTDPELHRHSLQRKLWRVVELEREEQRLREILEDDAA